MSLMMQNMPDLVIPVNTADSNIMLRNAFEDAVTILIFGPATITGGGTPVIQVTYDETPTAGGNWVTLQKGAADVVPPVALKAKSIGDDNGCVPACTGFRIHGTANFTGGAHTFKVHKQFNAY